ncbi:MAG TPA: peptide-methionine (S)-S-oxide reductase MsrA [Thermoanaerobaculia bacterium]|nr:peptide-methionine (S)-S-oxide reductase MsrA [Thermoanaerobaculia bacterium]
MIRRLAFFFSLVLTSVLAAGAAKPRLEKATFAGGCFWCTQHDFEEIPGVFSVTAGYTGGHVPNPTYEQVGTHTTGHAEAVEVLFDPSRITYRQLVDRFWTLVDPTTEDRQFCDWGGIDGPYRSEVFYHSEDQKRDALESKAQVERTKTFAEPIVTKITPAGPFYRAEEYHQDYWKKNPFDYHRYRTGCGRDARLKQLWGKSAGK